MTLPDHVIEELLRPPADCQAHLFAKSKRKGGPWFCSHAKKFIGKGAKRPDCLCRKVLSMTTIGLPTP